MTRRTVLGSRGWCKRRIEHWKPVTKIILTEQKAKTASEVEVEDEPKADRQRILGSLDIYAFLSSIFVSPFSIGIGTWDWH